MSMAQKGLGRGLGALFSNDDEDLPEQQKTIETPQKLAVTSIVNNSKQPRKEFDELAIADLAESIKEQGVLQPILVRRIEGMIPPRYEIIAGERRWRASKKAGLTEVPVIIKNLSDEEALVVALIENLQREDLNPLEEAIGIHQLKNNFNLSQDDLAKKLSKSRSAIANILRLLNLTDRAREALGSGLISSGHARSLLSFEASEQDEILDIIISEKLSVRDLEGMAAKRKLENKKEEAGQNDPSSPEYTSKRRLPQSALILSLQDKLEESLKFKIKISGREDKGKLSISYGTASELNEIINALGIDITISE